MCAQLSIATFRSQSGNLVNHAHYLTYQSLNIAASDRPSTGAIMHKCFNSTVSKIKIMLSPYNQSHAFPLMFPLKVITAVTGELTVLWWYSARTKEFSEGLVLSASAPSRCPCMLNSLISTCVCVCVIVIVSGMRHAWVRALLFIACVGLCAPPPPHPSLMLLSIRPHPPSLVPPSPH